jgi:YHYH protein
MMYRFPRTNGVPATKSTSGGGPIGIFVDGVAMYNNWDAYVYYNGSDQSDGMGNVTSYWYRDAYVNEGTTFDPGNAHQPGSGQYHYHANPPALRYELGDNVNFNATTKIYSEGTNTTKHSPILGWAADGFPIYGPYGYSVSNNASSTVRRMVSGYVIRNGSYGTSNLTANGRTTIPAWACRLFNVASNIQSGPAVSTSYPLGRYQEDNDYLGDHGYVQGRDFDLDQYNGRYCVTPDFPTGTYAYFVAIDTNGTPVYPYNVGMAYFGSPAGGVVTSIAESVSTNFLGYTNLPAKLSAPRVAGGNVTLTWSAIEGGTYQVEATTNLTSWTVIATNLSPNKITGGYTNATALTKRFYRVGRTAVATYTSAGTTTITAH